MAGCACPSSDAARRARAGTLEPHERPWLWQRVAASRMQRGLYASTLAAARQGACTPSVAKQIEKDLHRTFGSVHARGVRVPHAEALNALCNVLSAYAAHNTAVGYCQSMNFIVSMLLLVVDEETAFFSLASVVESILPGHFAPDMTMSLVDGAVLKELLTDLDPELMDHLAEMQVRTAAVPQPNEQCYRR
eukprot:scaffold305770_cov35-Tisochrysis_lutea.AAC.2